ncbi:hypothetical protein ACSBR2_041355 [Camellia fascicularis]
MNTESEPNEKREIEKVDNTEAVVDEIDDVSKRIPPWTKQVTVRGVIASIVIGCVYSAIAMKLNLTTGLTPHLNVSAALLAFIFMRAWTKLLGKAGIVSTPFTRQENTMIQTCSVACYTIAVGGGFGSYLLALNKKTYEQTGVNTVGNSLGSYKEPGFGWMTGFLFVVCFIGLFVLIPLRKKASTWIHEGFLSEFLVGFFSNGSTPEKTSVASHSSLLLDCEHGRIRTICPHIVNLSTLLGAVLSWGVMWPLLANFKGLWFPSTIPESSMKSLNGYKSLDILKQNKVFIRESIPLWVGASGYILFTVISVIVIPFIFPEVKWYYVIMSYLLAPSLAFCNAYGAGLTDINMSYNYGKVGLFALAALAGKQHGVVAGLAGCGLMKSVISVSCILMQDLKTGHLTLTSPRTMLVSQAIGTTIGCVVSPLCFLLFYKAFDVGNPNGEYKAPVIYRNIAILGVQGFSALPYHCLQLCYGFFAFAVGINLVKDFSPPRIGKLMPLPMAMAVPFLVGAYFSIDMCVGTLIVFVWHKLNPKKAELMVPVVASGLICGEGLWTLPESILSLAGVNPPMCMKFVAS